MVEAIRQGDIPGVQLRRRQGLRGVPVEEAWAWLTEPPKLEAWLCDRARVDPGPGGGIELIHTTPAGERHDRGDTLKIEPPNRWVLLFGDRAWSATTRLTLEALPGEDGSEVAVLQQGFQALPLSECLTIWEDCRRRWAEALERLAVAAGG